MARQTLQNRVTNTFNKGLITEATVLSFPKDASVDELNCTLERDGSRKRRKSIRVASGLSNFLTSQVSTNNYYTFLWNNVANYPDFHWLVIQVNHQLKFLDISDESTGYALQAFTVNLTTYTANNNVSISSHPIQVAVLNGKLFVTHPALNPFYLDYDDVTDTLSETLISFTIRDTEWLGDSSLYTENISDADYSNVYKYDARNAGWDQTKLNTYHTAKGDYPALTHPWYSGKDASGNFTVAEWDKIYAGNSLAANGHYILGLFTRNRSAVSGLPGLTTSVEQQRPQAVVTFAGRLWIAGINSAVNAGKIYFSQFVDSDDKIGKMYQAADPTSEQDAALVATDGGVIVIPDAYDIKILYPYRSSLIVFATNGIWQIIGRDGIFSPTEYFVNHISDVGIDSVGSFVSHINDFPAWWTRVGIYTLQTDQVTGSVSAINVSLSTIQTLYDSITQAQRSKVRSVYDQVNQIVYWMYPTDVEVTPSKKNHILLFSVPLQAFYPWYVEDTTGQTKFIVDAFFTPVRGVTTTDFNVVSNSDNVVSGTDDVIISILNSTSLTQETSVRFVCFNTNGLNVALEDGNDFKDWDEVYFSSYAETGYDFMGAMSLRKNSPIVTVYFNLTEEGFVVNVAGGYDPIHPSSCLMSAYWDLKVSPSTSPKEVYRLPRNIIVDETDLTHFNYPYDSIATRNSIRGRGRVLKLRFESQDGYDFHLLGFEIIGAVNSNL